MLPSLFKPRQIYSISPILTRKMHIKSIPMCLLPLAKDSGRLYLTLIFRLGTGTGDNYSYLIIDDKTKDTMIVDPAHPPEYVWNGVWERYHAN